MFDPIRAILSTLVILHHVICAYNGGGDYYGEIPSRHLNTLFSIILGVNQSFFMGFFFLIAGYFLVGSYKKKGEAGVLGDRMWRLCFPIFIFGYLLHPLSIAFGAAANGAGFWTTLSELFAKNRFGYGPLWFNKALILFIAAWCFLPSMKFNLLRRIWPKSFHLRVLLLIVITATSAFIIRLWIPSGEKLFDMKIGYFASYIVLFAVGLLTAERRILEEITWKKALPWLIVTLITFPSPKIIGDLFPRPGVSPNGGLNIPSLLYASWEPLMAAGIILSMLAFFRTWKYSGTPFCRRVGDAAFMAFIIHSPVTAGSFWFAKKVSSGTGVHFIVSAVFSVIITFILADALTRFFTRWKKIRSQKHEVPVI